MNLLVQSNSAQAGEVTFPAPRTVESLKMRVIAGEGSMVLPLKIID